MLRYRQTLFGVAWAVIQPLTAVAIFSVVFGSFAGIPSDNVPYPVFAIAGMSVWFFVSSAVGSAAASLAEDPELVTKVWFPRLLSPLAAVLAGVLDLVIATSLAFIVILAYGVPLTPQVLLLPIFAGAAFLVASGMGVLLAAANVLYRDVRHALPFLLQIWLFVSPVVFPISIVEEELRYVLAINPMTGVLEAWRWALLDGPTPGTWVVVSGVTMVLLVFGATAYFRTVERSFADRI